MIRMNLTFFNNVLFILFFLFTACKNKNKDSLKETVSKADMEVLKPAKDAVDLWLASDVEGVQFLKTSNWKIDDKVFLNSTEDKGYLLLLNQDKDTNAELDYVQLLYAAKENGKWVIYLASLPNLVIPREKENGMFKTNSLTKLAEKGEKEINNITARGNDDLINREYTPGLKRNQSLFLAKKIKK